MVVFWIVCESVFMLNIGTSVAGWYWIVRDNFTAQPMMSMYKNLEQKQENHTHILVWEEQTKKFWRCTLFLLWSQERKTFLCSHICLWGWKEIKALCAFFSLPKRKAFFSCNRRCGTADDTIIMHNGWPGSCAFLSEEGATVLTPIVPRIVRKRGQKEKIRENQLSWRDFLFRVQKSGTNPIG